MNLEKVEIGKKNLQKLIKEDDLQNISMNSEIFKSWGENKDILKQLANEKIYHSISTKIMYHVKLDYYSYFELVDSENKEENALLKIKVEELERRLEIIEKEIRKS